MANSIAQDFTPIYRPEISLKSDQAKDKVIGFYRDFQSSLGDLMKTLLNDKAPLQLNGITLSANQKTGPAGTMLIEQWRSEQEFIFSQLMDSYKFQQTLANKLNSFFGA